jgi:chromate reductase
MDTYKIAILIGSLRKGSYNRKMANAIISSNPENLTFEIIDISNLALYNEDLDIQAPDSWKKFREEIKAFDGVLFLTPEYNRSVPAVLKNAIDVGSRPYGKSVWAGKPTAIISVTPGNLGAFGANHHLRQSLVFLDMPAMQQPEAYISGASKLFDEQGNIINEKTIEFVNKFLGAFTKWVEKNITK